MPGRAPPIGGVLGIPWGCSSGQNHSLRAPQGIWGPHCATGGDGAGPIHPGIRGNLGSLEWRGCEPGETPPLKVVGSLSNCVWVFGRPGRTFEGGSWVSEKMGNLRLT